MEWAHIVEYCFYGLLSYAALDLTVSVRKTRHSVDELNIKIAALLEKSNGHEKLIDEHRERLLILERIR